MKRRNDSYGPMTTSDEGAPRQTRISLAVLVTALALSAPVWAVSGGSDGVASGGAMVATESAAAVGFTATAINSEWRIIRLEGEPVPAMDQQRAPQIVLQQETGRYRASVGCNTVNGGYSVQGNALHFSLGPITRMACPEPLDTMERTLLRVLDETRSFRLGGKRLELLDQSGATLAELQPASL